MLLRKAIGILGVSFPFILFFGCLLSGYCKPFQGSVSCYYHTPMRNVFEGVLWIFGTFLLFYRYEKVDNIATTCAGICALGVALFPCLMNNCGCEPGEDGDKLIGNIHLAFAGTFFIILGGVSIFLFTKRDPALKPTARKLMRNKIYIVCGILMWLSIVLCAVYIFLLQHKFEALDAIHPITWLEAVALWSFGLSWLTKGEVILKDV
jgi:hypothetical protein